MGNFKLETVTYLVSQRNQRFSHNNLSYPLGLAEQGDRVLFRRSKKRNNRLLLALATRRNGCNHKTKYRRPAACPLRAHRYKAGTEVATLKGVSFSTL